jgi:hypothetical protein
VSALSHFLSSSLSHSLGRMRARNLKSTMEFFHHPVIYILCVFASRDDDISEEISQIYSHIPTYLLRSKNSPRASKNNKLQVENKIKAIPPLHTQPPLPHHHPSQLKTSSVKYNNNNITPLLLSLTHEVLFAFHSNRGAHTT